MGKIEELEQELADLRRQVADIQYGLDHAQDTVRELKATIINEANRNSIPAQQPVYNQTYAQPGYSNQAKPAYAPTYQPAWQQQPVKQQQTAHPQPQVNQQAVEQQQPLNQQVGSAIPNIAPQPQRTYQQGAQPTYPPGYQPTYRPGPKPHAGSINESWIGKHLMGVFASILIFIALILFSSLIIPYLGTTFKIVFMFGVSIALTAFSYIMHKKKPENTFYTALLACGFGCCYLSVLVTRIYFKAFNDLVMYVLLLIWTAVVLFIPGKGEKLSQAIGNAGFVIAVGLSAGLKDANLLLPMLGYILISAAAHQFAFWHNKIQRNIQIIVNMVVVLVFSLIIMGSLGKTPQAAITFAIIMAFSALIYIFLLFAGTISFEKSSYYYAPMAAFLILIAHIGFGISMPQKAFVTVVVLILITIVGEIALIINLNKENNQVPVLFSVGWISFSMLITEMYTYVKVIELHNSGAFFIVAALIFIYGTIKEKDLFKNQALAIGISLTVLELLGKANFIFCLIAFGFAFLCFLTECFIIGKSSDRKIFTHLYSLVTLGHLSYAIFEGIFEKSGSELAQFIIIPIGIVNAVAVILKLYRDKEGNESSNIRLTLDIINGLLLVISLFNMFNLDKAPVTHALSVAFTAALAMLNVRRHLGSKSQEKLYAGIKLGVVILAALLSYDAKHYIISVVMLLFAIICIVVGFSKKFGAKELRIYGLVLSMICVAKFVMIDISYANTLGHALSFLVSGILCFGISAIYNYFEKNEY